MIRVPSQQDKNMKEDKCKDIFFIGYVMSESWGNDFDIGTQQGN